jgi:hypothetical protein
VTTKYGPASRHRQTPLFDLFSLKEMAPGQVILFLLGVTWLSVTMQPPLEKYLSLTSSWAYVLAVMLSSAVHVALEAEIPPLHATMIARRRRTAVLMSGGLALVALLLAWVNSQPEDQGPAAADRDIIQIVPLATFVTGVVAGVALRSVTGIAYSVVPSDYRTEVRRKFLLFTVGAAFLLLPPGDTTPSAPSLYVAGVALGLFLHFNVRTKKEVMSIGV